MVVVLKEWLQVSEIAVHELMVGNTPFLAAGEVGTSVGAMKVQDVACPHNCRLETTERSTPYIWIVREAGPLASVEALERVLGEAKVAICRLAKEGCGGSIWADPKVLLRHISLHVS